MVTESVLGLFRDPSEVADAADALAESGLSRDDMEVLSGAPYPEGAFGEPPWWHRLYWYPLVGAGFGLAVAAVIAIGTLIVYPTPGGRPIYSMPPVTILICELMALGAIISTVFGMVREIGRSKLRGGAYDPRIGVGYIGLAAACIEEHAKDVEATMQRFGATAVVRR